MTSFQSIVDKILANKIFEIAPGSPAKGKG